MSSDLGSRCRHCDGGRMTTRRKAVNREMLAMRSFPVCGRSVTVLARQASRPHLQQSGRATLPQYRAASGGTNRRRRTPGCWTRTWTKLRLRLMYNVTEYEVHPSCIMNMDETAAMHWAAWLGETEAGRTGALHRCR